MQVASTTAAAIGTLLHKPRNLTRGSPNSNVTHHLVAHADSQEQSVTHLGGDAVVGDYMHIDGGMADLIKGTPNLILTIILTLTLTLPPTLHITVTLTVILTISITRILTLKLPLPILLSHKKIPSRMVSHISAGTQLLLVVIKLDLQLLVCALPF